MHTVVDAVLRTDVDSSTLIAVLHDHFSIVELFVFVLAQPFSTNSLRSLVEISGSLISEDFIDVHLLPNSTEEDRTQKLLARLESLWFEIRMELSEFSSNHRDAELVLEPLRDGSYLPSEDVKRVCISVQRRLLRDLLDSSRDSADQRSRASEHFTAEAGVVRSLVFISHLHFEGLSEETEAFNLIEV